MTATYSPALVALSFGIATLASYTALELAGRVAAAGGRARLTWVSLGSIAMGAGIWSMHFTGMLAFHLTVPVAYDRLLLAASLLIAIAASAVALRLAARRVLTRPVLAAGGVVMGLGIAGMHYSGMAAMRVAARVTYDAPLVAASLVIAVGASWAALALAYSFRAAPLRRRRHQGASASVMGMAIAGMHYTAMAAARFTHAPELRTPAADDVFASGDLAAAVALGSVLILASALLGAMVDRRLQAQAQAQAARAGARRAHSEAVERTRDELEQHVRERTGELARMNRDPVQRDVELAVTNALLEHLVAAGTSLILRLDPGDLRVSYVSPNIGWILGYGEDEVRDVPGFWMEHIHPDDRDRVRRDLTSALAETTAQIEQEHRCRTSDGRYMWLRTLTRPEYDKEGRAFALLVYASDVSDRRQAEDEMRRAGRFLDSVIESLPNMVFVKDARSLRFVRINRAGEALIGAPRAALIGKSDYELFPRPVAERSVARDREVLASRSVLDALEELHSVGGAIHILHTKKIAILDEAGEPEYLLGIAEDITERKAAEATVQAAQQEAERANRAKSEFVSRMSHDLRTPLSAIIGFAQLLEIEGHGEAIQEPVSQILKGGRHLLALINEVLDIARIEAGHLSLSIELVDISEAIRYSLELVAPLALPRRITLDAAPCVQYSLADPQRLSQILLDLVSNAVKYNRDDGMVQVGCAAVAGGRLRIAVTDTGPGIAPSDVERLFQPFERLDADASIEGTGLGLTLSRHLARAMGGELGVQSEPGRGSTFWLELPAAAAPQCATPATAITVGAAARHAGGTVLYVEDNPSNMRLIQRVLERRPEIALLSAATGAAGLALARERRPDLILLDLHLPDMSGEEVLARLRRWSETAGTPVIVLTADATLRGRERLMGAGATAYLTKPLDLAQFLTLVDEMLAAEARR